MNRSGGQARLKKAMMAVMGNPVGVSRPPSLPLTDGDMESLKELMVSFGWPVPQAVAV
jgi:dihydrodipicolinate synthase/N-acetylneuraminate lyase